MIECDKCLNWFHLSCLNEKITLDDAEYIKWQCKLC